ncbi:ABC transporter substrate-binding protein [Roseateles toxinivorans]|uniref:ABC-type transport system substrate-binding protein n=1 Tax=Roseateles toxinivorans TaxID=270368 RepID=A0A4R6QSZ1_9BURK|nr:ABC transporter substrate-binding protein [Roseateles toxinivorans]TDP72961.1 ABC-type transport system substrate-binding protein [Roseateles toxinivorans]
MFAVNSIRLRQALAALLLAATSLGGHAAEPKVLRYAFPVAEIGFDPTQLSDIYSRTVTAHIFEALYAYDHLARPIKFKPLIAAALPEISPDFKTFVVRLRPGIYFADDAAFKGKRREVVAQDFVYSFKRFADPALKAQGWSTFEEADFVGLTALRKQAIADKTPFDYEREIDGIKALDRYTLQFKVVNPRPRLLQSVLAGNDLRGAVAREVVEFYGDKIMGHPVGTGPFQLKSWTRSSRMVLERNPDYRERFYDAEPAANDAEGQALLARFKGRRLPMVDRVEIAIVEEVQPRWLSFLNDESDFAERVPNEFITLAMPGGRLAPNLAKRGMHSVRTVGAEQVLTVFNLDDPVVGGYSADKVALRRAIGLGIDVEREIRLARRGQAIQAQSQIVPHTTGYSETFKSEMGDFDTARAKALLDMFGYVDKDGDGWRDQPSGAPMLLVRNTQPDNASRQLDELWQKNLAAIGIKIEFKTAKWPENLKSARSGKFMIWGVGSSADRPDGQSALQRLYGPSTGTQNLARFKHAEFDALYDRMQGMPDGPERDALFLQAKRIGVAFMPYKVHLHRIHTDMSQRWMSGFRRPLFWQDWWQYVDIDADHRQSH